MAVFSSQQHRPARRANGIRAKTPVEAHTLVGDAIEIRRVIDAAAVAAQRLERVVVGHDEEDVGALRLGLAQ